MITQAKEVRGSFGKPDVDVLENVRFEDEYTLGDKEVDSLAHMYQAKMEKDMRDDNRVEYEILSIYSCSECVMHEGSSNKVHRYSSTSSGLTIGSTALKSESKLKSRRKKKKTKQTKNFEKDQSLGMTYSASTVFDVNELSRIHKTTNNFLSSSKSSKAVSETLLAEKLKNHKKRLFPSISLGLASSVSAVELESNTARKHENEENPSNDHTYCTNREGSDSELMGGRENQAKGKTEHNCWPQLNCSDSKLMINRSPTYRAEVPTGRSHQHLSTRSCSLPELQGGRRGKRIMRCKELEAMPRPRSECFRYLLKQNCNFHSVRSSAI